MVGKNAERFPELVQRIREAGHTIGNHTYHHVKGWNVSVEKYMEEIHAAEMVLETSKTSSSSKTRLFRPPYGKMTWRQKRMLRKLGYEIYLWDVLTHDYDKNYTPERMLDIVRTYTRPGSIINFHDSAKSADRTPKTVRQVIYWLKNQGYTFGEL